MGTSVSPQLSAALTGIIDTAIELTRADFGSIQLLDAEGRKLSKSLAALPLDTGDPLPALSAAWALLGQPAGAVAGAGHVDEWLRRALRAFDESRLPRGPQSSPHRTT